MARKDARPSNDTVQRPSTPPTGTSYSRHHASYNNSPPRTPPSQVQVARFGRSKGAGGVQASRNRPALRDAFEDRSWHSDESNHTRDRSNSHELSWSPNRDPRSSVVDNMLASLDQFAEQSSPQPYTNSNNNTTTTSTTTTTTTTTSFPPFTDQEKNNQAGQRFASKPMSRGRGQTVSSTSSDPSLYDESPRSRGHRSNSSSNFQTTLGRIDSVRLAGGSDERAEVPTISTGVARSAMGHTQARKGSKSSGTSSVDLGAIASPRWRAGIDRRSSSFDHGYNRPAFPLQSGTNPSSPSTIAPQRPMYHDGDEAAPTPTVRAGPRRVDSRDASPIRPGAFRPGSSLSNTMPPPPRRRGSIKSPMAIFHRPDKSDGSSDHERTMTSRTTKGFDQESSQPHERQTSTTQAPSLPPSAPVVKEKEKERPGFFKRVFGSSRSNQQSLLQESTAPPRKNAKEQQSAGVPKGTENMPPGTSARRSIKSSQGPPLQKASTGEKSFAKEQPPHPLNKKSSFFRRRKRSVTGVPDVPVPPLQLDLQWQNERSNQDLPAQSLRHAMDPYLNSSRPGSRVDLPQNAERRGSEMTAKSTIRPVHKQSDSETIILPSTRMPFSNESDVDDSNVMLPLLDTTYAENPSIIKNKRVPPPSPITPILNQEQTSGDRKVPAVLVKDKDKEILKSKSSPRLWIQSDGSDDESAATTTNLPTKQSEPKVSASSLSSAYQSATSKQASPKDAVASQVTPSQVTPTVVDDTEPTEDDRLQAAKLFTGESDIPMADAAAWLGEAGPERARIRRAYMGIFDWQNMNILTAMRRLCNQLRLKGESQQVDRLLDSLSARWCECNPDHGFKATDVVHTICYSLLLLNTDLHLADIDQKMTRGQFIKNTMPTIRRVVTDAAPGSFSAARNSILPPQRPAVEDHTPADSPTLTALGRPTNRLTTRPSDHSGNDIRQDADVSGEECGPLVKTPFHGKQSTWEAQVEVVLKIFYNSIRDERLPLVKTSEKDSRLLEPQPSTTSLAGSTGAGMRRSNSMLSKAGSESVPARGRFVEARTGSRWSSKNRSRPRLYQASLGRASRTSLDEDAMSAISPSASSMWSKYSLGKTQTSMSVNSYSSDYPPRGDYQRSIGFANALSQAIIREDTASDAQDDTMRVLPLLEDESLELAGAPWAKEGMLKHKHHLESVEKKSKDRNWNECFAVVDKGWMRLFRFNASARSIRNKARNQKLASGVVGGGNWTENAESLGRFSLRQTIASALPPPGYSRARPHVFALSLPSGAVHLFQAGTPEIVREFVSSVNYWSARMSKEPLVGGVSNIEYGWSEQVINMALVEPRPSSAMTGPRPSIQSSIRGSIDQASSRPRLPGDKIAISDWTPPTVSMMESQLLEVDQLRALTNYVKSIEEELSKHQELRTAISLAFSPRHPNATKSMSNWERKSSYLLREIVKFRTYIDSLQQAQVAKEKLYKEREEYEKLKAKLKEVDDITGNTSALQSST